jgi:hypothetical protein
MCVPANAADQALSIPDVEIGMVQMPSLTASRRGSCCRASRTGGAFPANIRKAGAFGMAPGMVTGTFTFFQSCSVGALHVASARYALAGKSRLGAEFFNAGDPNISRDCDCFAGRNAGSDGSVPARQKPRQLAGRSFALVASVAARSLRGPGSYYLGTTS